MSALIRFACVALPLWFLWTLLLDAAAPRPPSARAQTVFVVSMVFGLVGSLWAGRNAISPTAGRAGRRAASWLPGLAMFAAIVLVGHYIGGALAVAPRP
jgi:hypothetical protein